MYRGGSGERKKKKTHGEGDGAISYPSEVAASTTPATEEGVRSVLTAPLALVPTLTVSAPNVAVAAPADSCATSVFFSFN